MSYLSLFSIAAVSAALLTAPLQAATITTTISGSVTSDDPTGSFSSFVGSDYMLSVTYDSDAAPTSTGGLGGGSTYGLTSVELQIGADSFTGDLTRSFMTVENDKPAFFGFGATDFFSLNLAFDQAVVGTSAILQTGVWEINFDQAAFDDNSVPSSNLSLPASFDSNATVRLLETLGTTENPIFAPTDLSLSLGGFDVELPETPPMSVVPLPATGSMLIAAAGILAMVRRRKRNA